MVTNESVGEVDDAARSGRDSILDYRQLTYNFLSTNFNISSI